MTCNKDLVSIFRSGLSSDNIGPIAKATFEVRTEVLLKAARNADIDHVKGVSANVMTGQYGCYGTSAFQLVLDNKAYTNTDSSQSTLTGNSSEFMNLQTRTTNEDPCSGK